jgi:GDP-mannose 4,6-dehydratase
LAKTALITGVTGQDGFCLAEFLLEKDYDVHGIKRRISLFNTERVDHIYQDLHTPDAHLTLHYGDFTAGSNLTRIINEVRDVSLLHSIGWSDASSLPARSKDTYADHQADFRGC